MKKCSFENETIYFWFVSNWNYKKIYLELEAWKPLVSCPDVKSNTLSKQTTGNRMIMLQITNLFHNFKDDCFW